MDRRDGSAVTRIGQERDLHESDGDLIRELRVAGRDVVEGGVALPVGRDGVGSTSEEFFDDGERVVRL